MQMQDLATAAGFHSWLQQRMTDGSWARDGVLHVRVTDFETPRKAQAFLKVSPVRSLRSNNVRVTLSAA